MIMHPFAKQLVGGNQLGLKDANGKPIFVEMIALAKKRWRRLHGICLAARQRKDAS